jgi:hypothetical protein
MVLRMIPAGRQTGCVVLRKDNSSGNTSVSEHILYNVSCAIVVEGH